MRSSVASTGSERSGAGEGGAPERWPHAPVLLEETLHWLAPRSGGRYVDCTLGAGGHAEAVLEASAPDGRLLGVDRDEEALEVAARRLARFGDRVHLCHAPFSALPRVMGEAGWRCCDGLIADLGVSSMQLDRPERGFSFTREGPLDMRMDRSRGRGVLEWLRRTPEPRLAQVLRDYGEERRARRVARVLKEAVRSGGLRSTRDLRRVVLSVLGAPRGGRIDPATRTFQALRIAVNDELGELRALVGTLPEVLGDGGVAVLISFHSLEDRIVKHAFREEERLDVLTRRPVTASEAERSCNPRSRSAKLRAARRRPRAEVGP